MRKIKRINFYSFTLCFLVFVSSCKTYKNFKEESNSIIASYLYKKHDSIIISRAKTKEEINEHRDYFNRLENMFIEDRDLMIKRNDFNQSSKYILIERYAGGIFKYNSFLFNKKENTVFVSYNSSSNLYNDLDAFKKNYPDIFNLYSQIIEGINPSEQRIKKDETTGDDYFRYSKPIVTIINNNKIIDFYEVRTE